MKNQRGITLVALMITIILLIILAGVAISTLSNNGIFERAKEARDKWQNAQNEEEMQIAKYSNQIESETLFGMRDKILNIEFISGNIVNESAENTYTYTATKEGKLLVTLFACQGDGGAVGTFYCRKNHLDVTSIVSPLDINHNISQRLMKCYTIDVTDGDVVEIKTTSSGSWGDNGYSIYLVTQE